MIHRFGDFELDIGKIELRRQGAPVAVEPQVFALLRLLIEQHDRVVSKEEIIAQVWGGRIVSESAISSRIKSARQALGDDGNAQRFIRTVHGTGFRFVGCVEDAPAAIQVSDAVAVEESTAEAARPSIAVIPFRHIGSAQSAMADALPQDLITELSRLRWLFVIARASSFRFNSEGLDIERVRSELNVRYCLSGAVELTGNGMTVSVELCDTQTRGIVWSERYEVAIGAVHEIRQEIVRSVINALELQIPLNEARRARLKPPDRLDAWSAYHLGLQHMYRFTKPDNDAATALFQRAVSLDPGFARAYAGLSFTNFQDAFLGYVDDAAGATKLAEKYAAQCLERDPVDPFGNLTMGRTFLLHGDLEGSLPWLDRANALNPNYAQAKYSRAWSEALLGRVAPSESDVNSALALSPLDPLRYAMLAVRAFCAIVENDPAKAADWAEQAARSPGAHVMIDMIAAAAHSLNDDDARAREWAACVRQRMPNFTKADFLRQFPFRPSRASAQVFQALDRLGF